jgi:hypothetical protein
MLWNKDLTPNWSILQFVIDSLPESSGDDLLLEIIDSKGSIQGRLAVPISSISDDPVCLTINLRLYKWFYQERWVRELRFRSSKLDFWFPGSWIWTGLVSGRMTECGGTGSTMGQTMNVWVKCSCSSTTLWCQVKIPPRYDMIALFYYSNDVLKVSYHFLLFDLENEANLLGDCSGVLWERQGHMI